VPLYHDSPDELSGLMIEFVKLNGEIKNISRLEERRDWVIPNYADMPIDEKDFLDVLSKYKEKLGRLGTKQ